MRSPGHGYVLLNSHRPLDAAAAAPLSASGDYGPQLLVDDASTLPTSVLNFFLNYATPGYTQEGPTAAVYNHGWVIGDHERDLGRRPGRRWTACSRSVPAEMSQAEHPDRLRAGREVTVEDVRQLMGASTPHFALQLRERIRALIRGLPAEHPARLEGEREIARLDRIAFAGEVRGHAGRAGPGAAAERRRRPSQRRHYLATSATERALTSRSSGSGASACRWRCASPTAACEVLGVDHDPAILDVDPRRADAVRRGRAPRSCSSASLASGRLELAERAADAAPAPTTS